MCGKINTEKIYLVFRKTNQTTAFSYKTNFYKNIGNMLNGIFTDIEGWFDRNSSAIFADVQTVE